MIDCGREFVSEPSMTTIEYRGGRAIWLGSVLLVLVGLAAILVPMEPLTIERRWSEAMKDMRTPALDHLALAFNAVGRGLGVVVTVAAVGLLLLARRRWLALGVFVVVECVAQFASSLLKALVGRPRPPHGLVDPVGSSFPSGHATYASATAVALVLLFTVAGRRPPWAWALAGAAVVGMAWSRTYLQVHWLLDVIAGSLLGTALALVLFAVAQMRLREASG